jgi:cathepsin D
VKDTIGLGDYKVQNQTFILATNESVDFGVAGIMGLAFPVLSRTSSTPWWLNALDQFEEPEMSFFFTE